MVTSSKKTTTATATKKPAAKKIAAPAPANKVTAKKTAAVATKKAAPAPVKKVSAPKTEKPANKPAATAKSVPQKSVKKTTFTPEERYRWIETAAYFRAEQRGFATGHETEDWKASEAQFDAMLKG